MLLLLLLLLLIITAGHTWKYHELFRRPQPRLDFVLESLHLVHCGGRGGGGVAVTVVVVVVVVVVVDVD